MTAVTPDTSVVVAALASWHPDHERARLMIATRPRAIAHVMFEAYSVLTRLPSPRRIDPAMALRALTHAFPQPPVSLPARRVMPLLQQLETAGISGGATYDGIVAETARVAGLALASFDIRARSTYNIVGVEVVWLG